MFLPQKDPTAIRLRENLATNTPVTFTGPIIGGTKISNKGNYEKSKNSVYISFDNSGYKSSLTPQISLGLDNQEPVVQDDVISTPLPVEEDAVVTTLPTNLLNILTENITGKMGSSQNNPVTPAEENDQEDAASCGIK